MTIAYDLAKPPNEPTYDDGRLLSYEDWLIALEPDFGMLDHHTQQSDILANPFDRVAYVEQQIGQPLAMLDGYHGLLEPFRDHSPKGPQVQQR